jgi:hypothetical protein
VQYKIYIPGADSFAEDTFHEAGVKDLCRDGYPDCERIRNGPDDGPGIVAQWRTGKPQIDAPDGAPEGWTWAACPPDGKYWVGINPEAPPNPLDLERKQQIPSVPVVLADGRSWLIPTARGIPHRIGIDYETGQQAAVANGRFVDYSKRAFQHASLLAERQEQLIGLKEVFFGVRLSDDDLKDLYQQNIAKWTGLQTLDDMDQRLAISILFDEALEHAIDALSINYRLNRFLVLHLQLLEISPEHDHLRDICLAAIEAAEIIETLKKNATVRRTSLLVG